MPSGQLWETPTELARASRRKPAALALEENLSASIGERNHSVELRTV
jgi:hypothetical protein